MTHKPSAGSVTIIVLILAIALATILGLVSVQIRSSTQSVALIEEVTVAKYAALSGLVALAENPNSISTHTATRLPNGPAECLAYLPKMTPIAALPGHQVRVIRINSQWYSLALYRRARVLMTASADKSPAEVFKGAIRVR